jgi:AcrR family transcriptional regulator
MYRMATMSHREDLLAGAVRCIREKGYARTTARDIVAASGTNLASIGYHYGSTEALLNAAVIAAMDEFGAEVGQVMAASAGSADNVLERFERFWTHAIDSFRASPQVWLATFDVFSVAQHSEDVRTALADGFEDGRVLWAQSLFGDVAETDQRLARAIGSLQQALLSGVLVQWLIDPQRAPSAADLAAALGAIGRNIAADEGNKQV